jgi:hypothetical protein
VSVGAAADPTAGIAGYLKAHEPINAMCGGRVYRPELPESGNAAMPQACIVVRPAGGGSLFTKDFLPVTDPRLDIVVYGSTRLEAENLAREVALALKMLSRSTWGGVLLFWARVTAQPASMIQPDTNWPFALISTQVMHGSVSQS